MNTKQLMIAGGVALALIVGGAMWMQAEAARAERQANDKKKAGGLLGGLFGSNDPAATAGGLAATLSTILSDDRVQGGIASVASTFGTAVASGIKGAASSAGTAV